MTPQTSTPSGSEAGFSLVEAMIASLVLVIGLVGMAQLLAVATVMHSDARQASTSALLAQTKIDEIMRAPSLSSAALIGGSLTTNEAGHFDQPQVGITRRWLISAGPVTDTKLLTVRVENAGIRATRTQEVTTVIRSW